MSRKILEQRRLQLGRFAQIARAEMCRVLGQLARSDYILLLADVDGVILERVCSRGYERVFEPLGLAPGFIWDERHEGTNGPGTCLHDRKPRLVHRDEHFFSRNIGMTCAAAPLWGPNGRLLGALDISGLDSADSRRGQMATLALVSTSARIIERSYFLDSHKDCWILRVHAQQEATRELRAGLLAVDERGQVQAADSHAPEQLGLEGYDMVVGRRIDDLFEFPMRRFLEYRDARPHEIHPITTRNGQIVHAAVSPPREAASIARTTHAAAPGGVRGDGGHLRDVGLSAYRAGDPVMAHNVWCAERVMNRNIHILLQGETGTGKDTFARAIHASGDRRGKPFIAVSCAAIPEALIESELFGYEPGAFTGARAGGMRGKLTLADGGTLFLDEIGDMPLALQARLLRMLEEKEVTPLGGSRPVRIDARVISATNKDLAALVATGTFRKDLFYRLNGLALTLPPLRERKDCISLIHAVATEENGGAPVIFSPAAITTLTAYRWPGNIRELRNVLATAIALADGAAIEPEHLRFAAHSGYKEAPRAPAACRNTPATSACQGGLPSPVAGERERLLLALERHHWNATASAAALGVSRNTFYRKLHKHGIRAKVAEIPGS